jgi:hypothetical protein
MAPLVILRPHGEVVVARRARLRERLAARCCASRLDDELARSVAPEARATLALRAQALGGLRMRRLLARSLRRVVDDETCARSPQRATVLVARDAVLEGLRAAAAAALDGLEPSFQR